MKRLAVVVALLALGCTDEERTRSTLEQAGYSEIRTGGYGWASCGRDDNYATEFTATNPAGRRVSGVVCCGVVKSCTVRFE